MNASHDAPSAAGPGTGLGGAWTLVQPARHVVAGAGSLAGLGGELARLGVRRALVVCGPHVAAGPALRLVADACGDRLAGTFSRCGPNTPVSLVDELVDEARGLACDGLLGVGGGSALDAVKGAALLLGEGGDLEDYVVESHPPDHAAVPHLDGPRLPMVLLPTTFAGAEATVSAGFARRQGRSKAVVVDRAPAHRLVLLDPRLCATTPPPVLAATYANALNHCAESLCSTGAGPVTDGLALHAAAVLARHIVACLAGDEAATLACQGAAYAAAMAMPAAGLGLCHAVGHVLGTHGVPHGHASAAVLSHAMAFNLPDSESQQRSFLEAMGMAAADPADGVAALRCHLAELGLPTRLGELDLARTELPDIAEHAFADRHVQANPRKIGSVDELIGFLEAAW